MPSLRSRLGTVAYRGLGVLPVPVPPAWSPVFLIGCGRSGTTITGQVLSQHRDICLLNEPRHVWRAINRETDIWYDGVNEGGKLALDADDVQRGDAIRASRMFYLRRFVSRRPLLVDKLPINSFRMAYLRRLFPTCRFVHVLRHGLEVAHSIARTGPRWYGANDAQNGVHLSGTVCTMALTRRSCRTAIRRSNVAWLNGP